MGTPCVLLVGHDRVTLPGEVRVLTADSIERALLLAQAETIDAALVPADLAARLRAGCPELPVVLITDGATDAVSVGYVFGAFSRPLDPGVVAALLRAAQAGTAMRERAAQAARQSRQLDAVTRLADVISLAGERQSPSEVLALLAEALPQVVRCDLGATLSLDPSPTLHLCASEALPDWVGRELAARAAEKIGPLAGIQLGADEIRISFRRLGVRTATRELPAVTGIEALSIRHAPLTVSGRTHGLLFACAFPPRSLGAEDEKLVYLAASQGAQALRSLTARLSDERRRMTLMVESMADGVILTDEKSEVVLVNAAARRMLGIPAETPITAKYLIDTLGFYPFDLVSRGRSEREELRWGKKVLHSIVSPVIAPGGKLEGVVVVLRDVTDWKELDQRKEEFVSVVSHELRTPLTSIAGALDIVLKEYAGGLTDKQRRYLEMARGSCARLNTIVDDLLDVARFERGKMAMQFDQLRLDVLAEECVERFRPAAASRGVAMTLRRHGDARIVGDPDRLTQVLHNLLSNAIKFTPEGGEIEIEVFGAQVAASHVGVSVWNNGDPIPEEARERIFDKFEQVSSSNTRRVGGTGLGLAISRSIVEGHGGRIWVEETQVGTKFVLTLPGAPDIGRREIEPIGPEETPPTGREVLVVDDDRYAAYLLKGVLMSAGHRVHVAHDAEDALAQARAVRPDLVTVDVKTAGADGLALLEILKHDPETRKAAVVVVSGLGDHAFAGADAVFTKPIDLARFRETCGRLLTERGRAGAAKVLVVDDDAGIRMICRDVLENAGFLVREAASGAVAVAESRRFRPDLTLLDVMMPDQDGFQTAAQLRAEPGATMMPVIFVSARGQTADKVRAFKLGAEDYLVKPFDSAELLARVEKALDRRDREIGVSPTTRLPGAGAIEAEIERRLAGGVPFAFCYVDLDNLKAFNDHYGIARADAVIRQTGDLLREAVARSGGVGDFVGHIAGDDFVLITPPERLDRVVEHLCTAFDRLVPLYYEKVDRDRGFIEAEDRFGVRRQFAIMSVSLAALTVGTGKNQFGSYAEVALAAAEAKQLAKAVPGTSYVRDGEVILPAAQRVSA